MSSKYILPVIMLLILVGAIYFSFAPDNSEKYVFLAVTFNMGGLDYQGYIVEGRNIIFEYAREGNSFSQSVTPSFTKTDEQYKNIEHVYVKIDTNGDVKYYEAEIFDETEEMVKYYVKEE